MNQNQKMRSAIDSTVLPFLFELGFAGSYPCFTKENDGKKQCVFFRPSEDGCSFSVSVRNGKREHTLPGMYGGQFRFGTQYRHLSFARFPFSYRGVEPDDDECGKKKWYEKRILSGSDRIIGEITEVLCRQLRAALE